MVSFHQIFLYDLRISYPLDEPLKTTSLKHPEYIACSSVGIAMGRGLDGQGIGVPFPVVARHFSLLHTIQTGFGTHPVSCTTLFLGDKAAET
jgi:hypothetical protein